MARPVIPNKRFSFNGLIDGWTDEHYVEYRPFSLSDVEAIKSVDIDKMTAVNGFMEMLKDHFVKGVWLVADDDGSNVRNDEMTRDDVLVLPVEVTNAWLQVAMGKVDPKQLAS